MTDRRDDLDIELIRSAQSAAPDKRSELVRRVEPRVYTYIYRMTLNDHVSEDLCQETLLTLAQSLPGLKIEHVSQFWGWVYRAALTRVQRHFRVHGNHRIKLRTVDNNDMIGTASDERPSVLDGLMNSEAHQAVIHAMSELQLRYRSVLMLRCLDQLSYAEIAVIMGGSEMQVRLWFFRARQSLRHNLAKKGLTRDCLLPALALFAYATASESQKAAAATAVTSASLHTPWPTTFAATIASRTGILVTCLILGSALLILAVGQRVTSDSSNGLLPMTPPTPRQENSLDRVYDTIPRASEYTVLTRISRVRDPNEGVWRYIPFNWPNLGPAGVLESMSEHPNQALLVLGRDRWVEYSLPAELADHPDVEVALCLIHWGQRPDVYITDGAQQQHRIFPTSYTGSFTQPGYKVLGFDLSPYELPFEIRGIRIVGSDNVGPYGGCGIGRPAAFLKVADQALSGND